MYTNLYHLVTLLCRYEIQKLCKRQAQSHSGILEVKFNFGPGIAIVFMQDSRDSLQEAMVEWKDKFLRKGLGLNIRRSIKLCILEGEMHRKYIPENYL